MSSNYCKQCGDKGLEGPPLLRDEFEVALEHVVEHIKRTDKDDNDRLLFRHGSDYYCYVCHCLVNNVCFHCDTPVDYLFRDKRCKSNSYVCEDCLKGPTNHIWKCYSNGCMTIEELAQEEFEMLNEDSI